VNYQKLLHLIEENITGERKERLLKLYDDFAEQMIFAPASGKEYFHLAFVGGYSLHIKNVADSALLMAKNFKQMGGTIDFTREELIFSALNHDLGKVGDDEEPYYIPVESEWHIKNQKKRFEHNPNLTHMGVTDRSLYLLQKYGVAVTQNEWIAIKCSDGLYDEANAEYLKGFFESRQLRTNLINIIHWADHMACRVEYDLWKNDKLSEWCGAE